MNRYLYKSIAVKLSKGPLTPTNIEGFTEPAKGKPVFEVNASLSNVSVPLAEAYTCGQDSPSPYGEQLLKSL